jgi:hypothetical protein
MNSPMLEMDTGNMDVAGRMNGNKGRKLSAYCQFNYNTQQASVYSALTPYLQPDGALTLCHGFIYDNTTPWNVLYISWSGSALTIHYEIPVYSNPPGVHDLVLMATATTIGSSLAGAICF